MGSTKRISVRLWFFLALLVLPSLAAAAAEPGEDAPAFVNPDLQKRHVWSRDYLAKGWVIVDFFATDCEGCKKELPILERLVADHGERGLSVLVLATDPDGDAVVALKRAGLLRQPGRRDRRAALRQTIG